MEGIGSGLLLVGFFVPVFYILSILSLPALLVIFFGQAGKSLYSCLAWGLLYTLFLELSMLSLLVMLTR